MSFRMYEQAWVTLRKLPEGEPLRIAAPRIYHRRILKAIIKEKDMDLIFKMDTADDFKRAVIWHQKSASMLSIYLRFTIGLSDF